MLLRNEIAPGRPDQRLARRVDRPLRTIGMLIVPLLMTYVARTTATRAAVQDRE